VRDVLRPVIRFSSSVEGGRAIIRFKTLSVHETHLMDLIDSLENYLAPDSLTIVGGWREGPWIHVTVNVVGYEKEYIERILKSVVWHRGVQLIKVVESEIEVD